MQAFDDETASALLLSRSNQLPAILGYQVLKGSFPAASLTFSQSLPTTDANGSLPLNVTVQSLGSNGQGPTVSLGATSSRQFPCQASKAPPFQDGVGASVQSSVHSRHALHSLHAFIILGMATK